MNLELLEKIKRIIIISLVSDDYLLDVLVLKGGNAINLMGNISNRTSIDLDYSIESEFNETEIIFVKERIKQLLDEGFKQEGPYSN